MISVQCRARRAAPILRWITGLAIVAIVLISLDVRSLPANLRQVDWLLAIPAVIGLTLLHVLGAFTWRLLTRRIASVDLPPWFAVRAYFASQLVGGLTPGNIGSDIYRIGAMGSSPHGWGRAFAPIIVQRASSYASVMFLCIAAAFFVPVDWRVRLVAAAVAGSFVLLAAGLYLNAGGKWPSSWMPGRADRSFDAGTSRAGFVALAAAFALGLAFHGAGVVLTFVLVASAAPVSEPFAAMAAITVVRAAALIPFTPSGLGVQEAAFALLLPSAGTTGGVAIAVAALVRLAMLLTMGAGLVALIAPTGKVPAVPVTTVAQGGAR